MIDRLVIRNIKRFRALDCVLAEHLLIVGPNNCGKTTLLQTIVFWSEIGSRWTNSVNDLSRDADGNYLGSEIVCSDITSMLLADWNHLWPAKVTREPASIRVYLDGSVIGFELIYATPQIAIVRPTQDVAETDLEHYVQDPIVPVYIQPMSGLDLKEPPYAPGLIAARLARGQAGTVLRNLLLAVHRYADKWAKLNETISDLFGYELMPPSQGYIVRAEYRERPTALSLDVASGASGFLQIVMIYAALLLLDSSVVLIDEPDAHLHVFLQERLYRDLKNRSLRSQSQLIVATHSERVIEEARDGDLRWLAGELQHVPKPQSRRLIDALQLRNTDLLHAEQVKRILYLEGKTDLEILRAWAAVLDHVLCEFLQEPFWKPMAEYKWPAVRHFATIQLSVPDLRGVELIDRNLRGGQAGPDKVPNGMSRLVWTRYEIENYLIYPESILRWLRTFGTPRAVARAEKYMQRRFPPAIYDEPHEADYFKGRKGKNVLREVCEAAQLPVNETDYIEIAAGMKSEEVHPEVVEKLDAIAGQLGVTTSSEAT